MLRQLQSSNRTLCCAGAIFFSLCFMALTSLTTVDLLVNERGLVVKEALSGYYRPASYYLAKGVLGCPCLLLAGCKSASPLMSAN